MKGLIILGIFFVGLIVVASWSYKKLVPILPAQISGGAGSQAFNASTMVGQKQFKTPGIEGQPVVPDGLFIR
jgi:hypothetical protein